MALNFVQKLADAFDNAFGTKVTTLGLASTPVLPLGAWIEPAAAAPAVEAPKAAAPAAPKN